MKKLIILATALVFAVSAAPAFASVQNVKISGSVDSTYLYRTNFDFHRAGGGDRNQSQFITQTTLQVDADLTDQVAATIALINERPWYDNPSNSNDFTEVDIYLAYVTLREMLYSPLTLVVGRQDFRYGASFVMDSAGTNNAAPSESGISGVAVDLTKQTTLDAIRAILDYSPLTVEIVYAQLSAGTMTLSDTDDGSYVTGFNATYALGDDLDSVLEGYFWKKVDKTSSSGTDGGKADVIKVVGGRFSTNPIEGLYMAGEFAYQTGNKFTSSGADSINRSRNAYGVQAIVNYQVPAMEEYNPVLQYVYTKVTGHEDNTVDNNDDYTGWDPFFESQGGGTVYNTLFNLSNAHIHSLSLQTEPMEDVTAKLSLHGLWLERNIRATGGLGNTTLVQPDGTSATVAFKSDNTWLGKEVDLDLTYDYTEDVQLGLNLGWFFPGSFFASSNDTAAKQVLANLSVAF